MKGCSFCTFGEGRLHKIAKRFARAQRPRAEALLRQWSRIPPLAQTDLYIEKAVTVSDSHFFYLVVIFVFDFINYFLRDSFAVFNKHKKTYADNKSDGAVVEQRHIGTADHSDHTVNDR